MCLSDLLWALSIIILLMLWWSYGYINNQNVYSTQYKWYATLFLSLLLLSCMVVLIRELVNILFLSITKHLPSSLKTQNSFNMDININTDILRGRSVFFNNNSSRESSMHSNTLFTLYHKRMEIQNDNSLWSEQVEIKENKRFSLLYATSMKERDLLAKLATNNSPKGRDQCKINMTSILNNIFAPQDESEVINNTDMCSF